MERTFYRVELMARTIQDLESEIRELAPDARRQLIRDLIADFDGAPDSNIEAAWLEEAERRYNEIKDGSVEAVRAEEVFAKARKRLKDGD